MKLSRNCRAKERMKSQAILFQCQASAARDSNYPTSSRPLHPRRLSTISQKNVHHPATFCATMANAYQRGGDAMATLIATTARTRRTVALDPNRAQVHQRDRRHKRRLRPVKVTRTEHGHLNRAVNHLPIQATYPPNWSLSTQLSSL